MSSPNSASQGWKSLFSKTFLAALREKWRARWAAKLTSDEVPLNPYRVIGDFLKTTDAAECIVTHESGNPRDQLSPIYESVTPRGGGL